MVNATIGKLTMSLPQPTPTPTRLLCYFQISCSLPLYPRLGGAKIRLSWGKSQAALKGPGFLGPIPRDSIQPDSVDRMNDAYISQKEDSLIGAEVEASGWRSGNQQIYA
jgi:hypothetical protein